MLFFIKTGTHVEDTEWRKWAFYDTHYDRHQKAVNPKTKVYKYKVKMLLCF